VPNNTVSVTPVSWVTFYSAIKPVDCGKSFMWSRSFSGHVKEALSRVSNAFDMSRNTAL